MTTFGDDLFDQQQILKQLLKVKTLEFECSTFFSALSIEQRKLFKTNVRELQRRLSSRIYRQKQKAERRMGDVPTRVLVPRTYEALKVLSTSDSHSILRVGDTFNVRDGMTLTTQEFFIASGMYSVNSLVV